MSSGTLHIERWGTDDGARGRALLLHGITSSAATMWEIGEGLAVVGWSAVAVDLPGHGRSGPADSYRFTDVADRVVAQVGPGWDVVLGHSLGGAIATEMLTRHPSVAGRGLLLDPALVVADAVADSLVPQLERDRVDGTEEALAAQHPHWHPRTVAERVRSTHDVDVRAVHGFATRNRPWDLADRARSVGVPVHVLVPSDEPLVTDDVVAAFAAAGEPRWTFETVPGTSHSVHRDRPDVVVERVLS